jgi:hypothetical protein
MLREVILDRHPTSPATYAQGQWLSPEIHETPDIRIVNLLAFRFTKNDGMVE